jgi:hypothetical protein
VKAGGLTLRIWRWLAVTFTPLKLILNRTPFCRPKPLILLGFECVLAFAKNAASGYNIAYFSRPESYLSRSFLSQKTHVNEAHFKAQYGFAEQNFIASESNSQGT